MPGKRQVQGAPWHKETPEVLLPGKSLAGPAVRGHGAHTWPWGHGSVCPPALGRGALALFDKHISCHFTLKALCELILLHGSRGKRTRLLAPFLSTQGRVSALHLGEGNLQPQEEAEKIMLIWRSWLQILYLGSSRGVLSRYPPCNSERSEKT